MKKGYIFVSPGSDPGLGKKLDDPIFGKLTTMGACRPDLRRFVKPGDYIFVVSGKSQGVAQFVIGGFSIDEKIDHLLAHSKLPDLRLKLEEDGTKTGNIIVNAQGEHHKLDHHKEHNFDRRIQNYLVGQDSTYLSTPEEILRGREETLSVLRNLFNKPNAKRVSEIIGRNKRMDEKQIADLLSALNYIKAEESGDKTS